MTDSDQQFPLHLKMAPIVQPRTPHAAGNSDTVLGVPTRSHRQCRHPWLQLIALLPQNNPLSAGKNPFLQQHCGHQFLWGHSISPARHPFCAIIMHSISFIFRIDPYKTKAQIEICAFCQQEQHL